MEKIRLNEQKRRHSKRVSHTVYNNMPMQVEEDLRLAQEKFRSVRDDARIMITPQVEAHYPMVDMKISKSMTQGSYDRFTTTDSCFYFKPIADVRTTLQVYNGHRRILGFVSQRTRSQRTTKRLSRWRMSKHRQEKPTLPWVAKRFKRWLLSVAKANELTRLCFVLHDRTIRNDNRVRLIATSVSFTNLFMAVAASLHDDVMKLIVNTDVVWES